MFIFSEDFSRKISENDRKEISDAMNHAILKERDRILQIIHYVDLNYDDPTGEIHDKLDIIREKVICGKFIEDYKNTK